MARDVGHLLFPHWIEAAPQSMSVWRLVAGAVAWGIAAVACMAGMYRTLPTWGMRT
ncbi:hypothetical protein [Bosea sp. FBZP-16]|uniref:hypothetical protein n=1 Tax=Bosea sp. FBZP-16 TaxID=2065382 RepID=UPI001319FBBD|nr:hypothetical protein [Bosea sp. FBZP-16]